jgi:hypothetical protein
VDERLNRREKEDEAATFMQEIERGTDDPVPSRKTS